MDDEFFVCGHCRWWDMQDGDRSRGVGYGYCTIDPPHVVWCEAEKKPRSFWPSTLASSHGCASWESEDQDDPLPCGF